MARFTGGWVKIYREAWEKDLNGNVTLWALWNALLVMAVWKPTKILWEGTQRELQPGSIVFGVRELSEKWDCSRTVIKKWLHYLRDTERILIESCPRGMLVTICNWDIYQSGIDEERPQSDHRATTERPQSDHSAPLIKEYKNIRKKEMCVGVISELRGSALLEEKLSAVSQDLQRAWVETYFDVVWIRRQLLQAASWSIEKKKSHKAIGRFFNAWLARAENPPAAPPVAVAAIAVTDRFKELTPEEEIERREKSIQKKLEMARAYQQTQ